MSIEYKILENPSRGGTLTIKIEDNQLSFNHTKIHEKDEFEEFTPDDMGYEMINQKKTFHINGQIISDKEFEFVENIIEDL